MEGTMGERARREGKNVEKNLERASSLGNSDFRPNTAHRLLNSPLLLLRQRDGPRVILQHITQLVSKFVCQE